MSAVVRRLVRVAADVEPAHHALATPSTRTPATRRRGQNRGQATYAFATLDGSREELERAVRLAGIGRTYGGAGVYWNVAKP